MAMMTSAPIGARFGLERGSSDRSEAVRFSSQLFSWSADASPVGYGGSVLRAHPCAACDVVRFDLLAAA